MIARARDQVQACPRPTGPGVVSEADYRLITLRFDDIAAFVEVAEVTKSLRVRKMISTIKRLQITSPALVGWRRVQLREFEGAMRLERMIGPSRNYCAAMQAQARSPISAPLSRAAFRAMGGKGSVGAFLRLATATSAVDQGPEQFAASAFLDGRAPGTKILFTFMPLKIWS